MSPLPRAGSLLRRAGLGLALGAAVLVGCSDDDATPDAAPTSAPEATDDPATTDRDAPGTTQPAAGSQPPDTGGAHFQAQLPDGFPAAIPLPEGGTVQTASEAETGGNTVYSVSWTVEQPAAEVFEQLVAAFEAAGFEANNRSSNRENERVSASADLEDGEHLVTLNVRSLGGRAIVGYFVAPADA